MITRPNFYHPSYGPIVVDGGPGGVRVLTVKGIQHTWATARPSLGYSPNGAPHYLGELRHPQPGMIPPLPRGERATTLSLTAQNVAADLTDSSTWQRPYTFTQ